MINNKRVIAVIPARGGSKSIPYKNIKLLAGKPLIQWTIEEAKKTPEIDRIVVSTDDYKIENVAIECGAEVIERPEELARDDSLVIDAIRDLISKLRNSGEKAEYMILLEPTCPLRASRDIRECIELLDKHQFDSVATFKEADLNPHRAWRINNDIPETFITGAIPWLPRQKLPTAYQLNGAVYAFRIDKLQQDDISLLFGSIGAVLMPKSRSVDIDDEMDFLLVETLIKKGLDTYE
ncbi:N-acylneuraminate cytidylyltransferase [Fontibacillus phaseoli]|uniref:N-acylneuraminate cytidylyltransferase n=1 Tax=Fontibacillus phaseoli TaxID=1416533 RepID=A0A369BES8_9BACL|nr:acylneuraminate cytidylyltransferase family protein [Fontibacillus phaseoli]RCX19066.1 N-acylneuraminate cytidylyltransferase [Fontibacillus phaseoli]